MENEFKAGGTDYVPPALCPRPAHANGTGRAGRRSLYATRSVRPMTGNHPILTWEAAC
ncbi:MAG TPA: hypothetical protein PLV64_01545 [Anaerolineales bacterium]|nr:hypothetical protein [Anaerolineales bacterium]